MSDGALTVLDSAFVGNRVKSDDDDSTTEKGGAIFLNSEATCVATRCSFDSNKATAGSAIYNAGAAWNLVITNPIGLESEASVEDAEMSWSGGVDGYFLQCAEGYYVSGYDTWSPSIGVGCVSSPSGSPTYAADCQDPAWGVCEACREGEYSPLPNQPMCFSCGAGTHNPHGGTDSQHHDSEADCVPCSVGQYSDVKGSRNCTACPEGTT